MNITNIIKNNKNVNINIYNCKKCCSDSNDVDILKDVNNEEEEFKRIEGYDNYIVSNFGNIKNNKTNKIMKLQNHIQGYKQIGLTKNGKQKYFLIHRLVGKAFLENFDNKPVIDHIDENKSNNNIKNLRWATNQENQRNQGKYINNTTGYKGVSFDKHANKYVAHININGKIKHLGYYETAEEASKVYEAKAKVIHKEFYYKNK